MPKSTFEITVPPTRSAVSILSADNGIPDGVEFRDDGYIYRDGRRLRKYFVYHPRWKHYWEPGDEPGRLARLYSRLQTRFQVTFERLSSVAQEIIATGRRVSRDGESYFVADHRRPDGSWEQHWIRPEGGWVYGFARAEVKRPINQELGEKFHRLERYAYGTVGTRAAEVGSLLELKLARLLREKGLYPEHSGVMIEVDVGDQKVWMLSHGLKNGVLLKLSNPPAKIRL